MMENSRSLNEFVQYLIEGNRPKCSAYTRDYLARKNSVMDLYEHVFKPALYEVGRLWETNQISVATEHLGHGNYRRYPERAVRANYFGQKIYKQGDCRRR